MEAHGFARLHRHGQGVSDIRLRFTDQRHDFFWSVSSEEVLSHFRVAHEPAGAGEQGQMLRHRRGDQQEKQLGGFRVDGAVGYALVVPAKNDHRLFDQTNERVAGMGQGDAVADAGAVELLALLKRMNQGLLRLRAGSDFRNPADQFIQHFVALTSTQTELNGRRGNEVADQQAF